MPGPIHPDSPRCRCLSRLGAPFRVLLHTHTTWRLARLALYTWVASAVVDCTTGNDVQLDSARYDSAAVDVGRKFRAAYQAATGERIGARW